jgi:hypothetical protein
MYSKIHLLERCFVIARTTKYLNLSAQSTDIIFSEATKVFTTDRWDHYSVVQSTIHEVWARKYSGALKQDLRYSPSKCFDTFAFPAGQWQHPNPDLAAIGERYHEHRRDLMLRLWLGLTDIYNLFHAPDLDARLDKLFQKRVKTGDWHRAENVPPEHRATAGSLTHEVALAGIKRLRQLHVELDYTVLEAYGWAAPNWRDTLSYPVSNSSTDHSALLTDHSPIHLAHDFQQVETLPENDRTRYTITPAARKELLTRLLKLNHHRADEEEKRIDSKNSSSLKGSLVQREKGLYELL